MITVIYSSHKSDSYNEEFNKHIKETIGVSKYEILPFKNFGEFSLSQIYNKGIEQSNNDILVCVHNDIKLEKGWGQKLLKEFKNNPDFGIVGKAGSCYFPESGIYWERMEFTMVGQVYHHPKDQKKWLSVYSNNFPTLIPVVTIDGLFMAFDKTKIKHKFDETIGKFHFYDHGFCVPNYLDGVKIGVTSAFEITHESVGQPNQEFFESKEKFVEKYKNVLPIDFKPTKIYYSPIKRKKFKNFGKVAVIIPTKGKVKMLKECLNSFLNNCDSSIFEIFIADTGSEDNDIIEIENFIKSVENKLKINLLKYDFYNFATINNDVVNNHINDDFEFLLFCNNDIKILNDVITGMLNVYQNNNKVGTVGARLHFEDNTIQHDGIFIYLDQKVRRFIVTHRNRFNYYRYSNNINKVLGNTAGLSMIRKEDFIKCGLFNESYTHCFEDVELNLKLVIFGYENYINSDCVAIHYESKTRDVNENLKEISFDFQNKLHPFITNNFEKLKSKIFVKN